MVEEVLDRYCTNAQLSLSFLNALVSYIDSYISDCLPILLKLNPSSNVVYRPNHHTKRFHFEKMWFTDPSRKEMVATAWYSSSHLEALIIFCYGLETSRRSSLGGTALSSDM